MSGDTQRNVAGRVAGDMQVTKGASYDPNAAQERLERLYALLGSGSQEGGSSSVRLPLPTPSSSQRLTEQLAQLRASNRALEEENRRLRAKTQETSKVNPGAPADSQLRQRVRQMLEEQRRLVDDLQAQIGEELSQAGAVPQPRSAPMAQTAAERLGSPRLAPAEAEGQFAGPAMKSTGPTSALLGQRWLPTPTTSKIPVKQPVLDSPRMAPEESTAWPQDMEELPPPAPMEPATQFQLGSRLPMPEPGRQLETGVQLPYPQVDVPELRAEQSDLRLQPRRPFGQPVRSRGSNLEPPPAPGEEPSPWGWGPRAVSTRTPAQHKADAEPPAAPEEWDSPRDVHGEGNVSQTVYSAPPKHSPTSHSSLLARSPAFQGAESEPPPAPEEEALDKDQVKPAPSAMQARHSPSSSQSTRSPMSMRSASQHEADAEPPAAPEEWDSPRDVHGEGNVSQAVSPYLPAKHPPSSSHSSPLSLRNPAQHRAEAEPATAPEEWDSTRHVHGEGNVSQAVSPPLSMRNSAQHKDVESEPFPEEALEKGEVSPAMSLASNPSLSSALKGEDRPSRPPSVKRAVSFSEPPESPGEPGSVDNESHGQDTGGVEQAPESKAAPVERPLSNKTPVDGQSGSTSAETDADDAAKAHADWQKQQLAEGIILLKKWTDSNAALQLCISNKKLSDMKFTVNIGASTNLDFAKPEGSRGAKTCTVLAAAAADTDICELRQVDHRQSSRLSMAFNWEPQQVKREELQKLTSAEQQRRRELATELEQQGITSSRMTASEIKDACSRAGISKFVDADFMPCDESLFQKSSNDQPAVMWKRPEDFCKGSFQVFTNDILPSDIKQGALGDCWFLAALAAVAEDPDLIRRLLGDPKVNKHGVYEIKCFKNGRPTSIVVDDFFPCSPNSGLPCYAHVDVQGRNQNELWVMLLEKAWAKLHGCYERIESGMPYRALMDLLGAAGKEYHLETEKHPDGLIAKDKFFSMLCKYDQAGYLMVAGTPGSDSFTKGDKSQIPLSGLIPGHAYTLLSAHEANGVRLLRLRNPWGDHEWTGDWSDKSSLWTQAMKDAVTPKPSFDANDGEFWMCYRDFLSHFSSVGVAFLSDSWSTTRNMLSTDGTDMCRQVVSIRSSSPIKKGFITLFQQDERMQGAPPYTQLSFALYGPLEDGKPQAEVLRSHLWPVRELVEEIPHSKPLPAGEYLVAIFTPKKVPDRQLTLVLQLDVTGHCEVTTKEADDETRKKLALASALSGPARAIGPASTRGAWLPNGGYALAASCAPRSKALAMSFDFSRCKGLALRGDGTKVDMVFNSKDPEEMRLIGDLQPMESKKSFSVSTSYQEVR